MIQTYLIDGNVIQKYIKLSTNVIIKVHYIFINTKKLRSLIQTINSNRDDNTSNRLINIINSSISIIHYT